MFGKCDTDKVSNQQLL